MKEGKTNRKKGEAGQKPAETLSAVADTDGRKVENHWEERGRPTEVEASLVKTKSI
jgi:hypothetical protein